MLRPIQTHYTSMKKINFQNIKIKNFLSVGSDPVEVSFKKGLHIITGINKDKEDRRNGVGKSTIADAIYFAVFGETLRDLKKEHVINNVNKKGCEVELCVQVQSYDKQVENIRIVRTLEPSKCFVYVNDVDKTRDSITNTTDYILKKFECTPDIFQNCVIMTVNNTIPFMAKKKQEKRKFIEDIFNLSIFGEMLSLLKVDINEKKKQFDIETTKFDESIKTLSTLEKQRDEAVVSFKKKHDSLVQRRESNREEIDTITKKISQIDEESICDHHQNIQLLNKASEKLNINIQETKQIKTEKTIEIQQLKKQHETIGTERDVCSICLRPVTDHDREYIESEKNNLKTKIISLAEEVKEYQVKEQDLTTKQRAITEKVCQLQKLIHQSELNKQEKLNLIQRLEQLNKWQEMLQQDIQDLSLTTESTDKAIEEIKERISCSREQIENIKKELSTFDVVKFVVSEEGVKSYVVKKILKLFNSRLSYYLKKMDANCLVTFNEYFEEEIVDTKGKPCSYFNFSGAERKNIDLACLFTFMDIRRLQGDVSFNFSIYDELFDSSLDERGIELVVGILKERVEKFNECIMVISHRKESIKSATGDIIFLEKTNGITKRIDYKESIA